MHHWRWLFHLLGHDNWQLGTQLALLQTTTGVWHQFVMVSDIPTTAKVSCIQWSYNDEWKWSFLSLPAPTFLPNPNATDSLIWTGYLSSQYQTSHAWNAPQIHHPLLTGIRWFDSLSPSLDTVLSAVRGNLRIKDKLHSWASLTILFVLSVTFMMNPWIIFFFSAPFLSKSRNIVA